MGITSGSAALASAGASHVCLLMTSGRIMCWGGNNYGQLGDGSKGDRHTPVDVG
ncbi:hypothetical protein [Nostocoides sp.]